MLKIRMTFYELMGVDLTGIKLEAFDTKGMKIAEIKNFEISNDREGLTSEDLFANQEQSFIFDDKDEESFKTFISLWKGASGFKSVPFSQSQ